MFLLGFVWVLCVVWFFGLFACFRFFGFVSCFPCFFARLGSFTGWCTAHRQQFREQKNQHLPASPSASFSSIQFWQQHSACSTSCSTVPFTFQCKTQLGRSGSWLAAWFGLSYLFGLLALCNAGIAPCHFQKTLPEPDILFGVGLLCGAGLRT